MADRNEPVKIRVGLPREAAEYAVQVLSEDSRTSPVDLVRPDGSHGADWPMFASFVQAAIMGVITDEWHKRERPNGPALHDGSPLPDWVTAFKRLQLVWYDEVP